jgi:hypothetical protein
MVRWLTAFVDVPPAFADRDVAFWQAVTGSTLSARRGDRSQFVTLLPATGDAYLRAQTVFAGAGGSHLDLHADDPGALAERARSLGATTRYEEPGLTVLDSPAGLAFCVVTAHGEAVRPAPVTRGDGTRSLVDQLCLDLPPDGYERECGFWSALTGWQLRPGSRPEFQHLARPAGMPLRLLLQRLGESRPATAHLDLACDDLEAEAAWHVARGARRSHRTADWITLRDPAGLPYCVTRRSPDTGTTPD